MAGRRGRGEGSIQRREKEGRWAAVIELELVDGKRKRKTVYGRTRQEVAHKLTDLLKARKDELPIAGGARTVGAFLTEWLELIEPTVRPRTWQRYEEYVRLHVKPFLGTTQLRKVGAQDLQKLYAQRLRAGLSAQSVVHLHRMLHKAFKQAVRWELAARNPTDLVDPPRVKKKPMRALTAKEVDQVLAAAAGDPLEALYVLAITTGLRQGELLGLHWRDIDLDASRLQVVGSLQPVPGKGLTIVEPKSAGSRRLVIIGRIATDALRRHRAAQDAVQLRIGQAWEDNDLVFANGIGRPIGAGNLLVRSFRPLLERAAIPQCRFHDLRHTTATLLLGQGVHPKIVSEMLGHSTVGITLDLYSHVTPTMQQQAADALDELIGNQLGHQTGSKDDVCPGQPS